MTLSRVVVLPRKMMRLTKYCLPSSSRIVMLTTGSVPFPSAAWPARAAGDGGPAEAEAEGGGGGPAEAAGGGGEGGARPAAPAPSGPDAAEGDVGSLGKPYSGTPVNSK